MKKKHPDFTQMNDLLDGLIEVEEEREQILSHIESCPECGREYSALKASVNYLKELKHSEMKFIGLSSRVQRKIRNRRVRRYIIKSAPAAAAAVVLALGLNLFISPSSDMAEKTEIMPREKAVTAMELAVPEMSSVERLADIIKRNRAKVTRDTAHFIEGEIPVDSFSRFRREMGFRKVSYSYVAVNTGGSPVPPSAQAVDDSFSAKEGAGYPIASRAKSAPEKRALYMDKNLTTIGAGDIQRSERDTFEERVTESEKYNKADQSPPPGEEGMMVAGETKRRFVKFRVYK